MQREDNNKNLKKIVDDQYTPNEIKSEALIVKDSVAIAHNGSQRRKKLSRQITYGNGVKKSRIIGTIYQTSTGQWLWKGGFYPKGDGELYKFLKSQGFDPMLKKVEQ